MKLRVAIEWFINPDHLPLIAAIELGELKERGVTLEIIEPDAHYDGFDALKAGEIELATNEPLHLIEQFDPGLLDLGMFFETKGGVMFTREGEAKLRQGQPVRITTPVSNAKTDRIAFEIIDRYAKKEGFALEPGNVMFEATDFYHIQHIKEGFDGAWLYFYNFEGIEAKHEGLDVVFLDAPTCGFANFCALDLFTTKAQFKANPQVFEILLHALRKAVVYLQANPGEAKALYYRYTKTEPNILMDDIIDATLACFDPDFASIAARERHILEFFNTIGVTDLAPERFDQAFLTQ